MTVVLFIFWAMASYLACRVAYIQGRTDKWREMSRYYICLHKSVLIKRGWDEPKFKKKKQAKKHLTSKK